VLPFRSNVPEISKFTFERVAEGFYSQAEKTGFADCVVLGGENYGLGSSREHAALGPMFLGVRLVLAKSFARIHAANLVNFGIIPLAFSSPEDYAAIEAGDTISVANLSRALKTGEDFALSRKNAAGQSAAFSARNTFDRRSREILLAGGLAAYTRQGGK
jgi:aconitate hydratase